MELIHKSIMRFSSVDCVRREQKPCIVWRLIQPVDTCKGTMLTSIHFCLVDLGQIRWSFVTSIHHKHSLRLFQTHITTTSSTNLSDLQHRKTVCSIAVPFRNTVPLRHSYEISKHSIIKSFEWLMSNLRHGWRLHHRHRPDTGAFIRYEHTWGAAANYAAHLVRIIHNYH